VIAELLPDVTITRDVRITPVETFAAVEEPGADPLVGVTDEVLIPAGGDVMVYGDGGAGKTTLMNDLALHLAGPRDWLGFQIPRAVNVLVVENEGPRPLLRRKLARKLAGGPGPPPPDRQTGFVGPGGGFTFATAEWQAALATAVGEHEIDVLIAGPLTRIGMTGAGTLQEVNEFMAFIDAVRQQCGRQLTVILVHHENKGGTVSGAWEGSGDTLLHVEARGNGFTHLHIQKARWSSQAHGTSLDLAWTDGESFRIKESRDLLAEIEELLSDGAWRTVNEIVVAVGAGKASVRQVFNEHGDRFAVATGEDARSLGRSPRAKLYRLASA